MNFNANELQNLAKKVVDEYQNGKYFLLSDVFKQARQAYEKYPEDPVIRLFAFTVEKMAEKQGGKEVISQKQLSQIHNDVAGLSSNSRFREVLGGYIFNNVTVKKSNNDFVNLNRKDADNSGIKNEDLVNQSQVEDFSKAIDSNTEARPYNEKIAETGRQYVELELKSLGFENPRVKVVGGDHQAFVYSAEFDTEKGKVSVAIPVDIVDNRLTLPNNFIVNDQLKDLTASNLQYHIDKTAKSDIPDYHRLGKSDSSIYMDTFPDSDKKVSVPESLAHLSTDFENDLIESATTFGKEAIDKGRETLVADLKSAGFKNPQVKFAGEAGNSVIYYGKINTPRGVVEVELPVEMKEQGDRYIPLSCSHFSYDGVIETFGVEQLQRFAATIPIPSTGTQVYTTTYNYMTLPEVKKELLKNAAENNYEECEVILKSAEEKFAENDLEKIISDYHYMLGLKTRAAEDLKKYKCNKEIAAGKTSLEPVCGHTLLPMSRVITAENGECRPITSEKRAELNDLESSGAAISNSKILWT